MRKKFSILISDSDIHYCKSLSEYLYSLPFVESVMLAHDGAESLEMVSYFHPDVVILDILLPIIDGMTLIKKLTNVKPSPTVIVNSEHITDNIASSVLNLGVIRSIRKSYQHEVLGGILRDLHGRESIRNMALVSTPESFIINALRDLSVPAHFHGYMYLRSAILYVLEDVSLIHLVTKRLYPMIAKKYSSTTQNVERSIRHAIEIAWQRSKNESLEFYFGKCYAGNMPRPTNSEFIAGIADRVGIECRNYE